jgi:hypothetical protein
MDLTAAEVLPGRRSCYRAEELKHSHKRWRRLAFIFPSSHIPNEAYHQISSQIWTYLAGRLLRTPLANWHLG